MIVGCINNKTVNGCVDAIHRAAEKGASMVELRLDYLKKRDENSLQTIFTTSELPIIATFKKKKDGGLFAGDEDERIGVLKTAIRLRGIDFVDIEIDASKKHIREIRELAHESNVTVIASKHYFKGTPNVGVLTGWLAEASKIGDMVKIVTKANDSRDCTRILNLLQIANEKNITLIAFAMGKKGRSTRIESLNYSPWTYCATTDAVAPGQMSISAAKKSINLLV